LRAVELGTYSKCEVGIVLVLPNNWLNKQRDMQSLGIGVRWKEHPKRCKVLAAGGFRGLGSGRSTTYRSARRPATGHARGRRRLHHEAAEGRTKHSPRGLARRPIFPDVRATVADIRLRRIMTNMDLSCPEGRAVEPDDLFSALLQARELGPGRGHPGHPGSRFDLEIPQRP
jgi:hypothetical protein